MTGRFLSPELKFIEANFTGPTIDLSEFLTKEEQTAINIFEGPSRRLKRNASHYLCKFLSKKNLKIILEALNYRRWSTKQPVLWDNKAVTETIELTVPYSSDSTSEKTLSKILKNIFLPIRITVGL